MRFNEINIKDIQLNPFTKLDSQWALLSAGTQTEFNTMTISWGAMGTIWNKPVFTVFVRPQRYTKSFIDKSDYFTLSFFSSEYKKALSILGSKSGRDGDKVKESGLKPLFIDKTVAFEEAESIYICRKIFGGQQIDSDKIIEKAALNFYPQKDYHFMYFGEVEKTLIASKNS